MRPFNYLATTLLAAFVVVSLGACGNKKKTSSSPSAPAASTPGSQCVLNPLTGGYTVIGTNNPCTPAAQQITCPAAPNNYYTNQFGQLVQCTPGTTVTVNNQTWYYPGQYPYGQLIGQGCDTWNQQYWHLGAFYVPMYFQGQLQCVNIGYGGINIDQYTYGTPYYRNYDYYYYYPPYVDNGGYCGNSIFIDLTSYGLPFGGNFCF